MTGGEQIAINFLPGSNIQLLCLTGCGSEVSSVEVSYASESLNSTAVLYEGILAGVVIATVLAALAGAFGVVGAMGLPLSRKHYRLSALLSVAPALILLGLVVGLASGQTGVFARDASPILGCDATGIATPCNSFWGSATSSGASIVWGGGVGWYAAIVGGVLLLIGSFLYYRTRPQSFGECLLPAPTPTTSMAAPAGAAPTEVGPSIPPSTDGPSTTDLRPPGANPPLGDLGPLGPS